MSEENKEIKVGFCSFCGQGHQYPDVTVDATQEDLDKLATDQCSCSEAKSFKRQKERRERVDKYIQKQFSEEAAPTIKELVQLVEHGEFKSVVITSEMTGWKTTMKTDKDGYLVITKKRTVQGDSFRE